jgi:hypothetical protein
MITDIVFIDLPRGISRAKVMELYNTTAPTWAKNEDLIEKYYFFDKEKSLGGGIYIWKTRAAQQRWHGPDYHEMVQKLYGSPPRIEVLEAVIRVDATTGNIHHFEAAE